MAKKSKGGDWMENYPSRTPTYYDILWVIMPEKSHTSKDGNKSNEYIAYLMNKYSKELTDTLLHLEKKNATLALLNPTDIGCVDLSNIQMVERLLKCTSMILAQLNKPLVIFCSTSETDIEVYDQISKALKTIEGDGVGVAIFNTTDPVKVSKKYKNFDHIVGTGSFTFHLKDILKNGTKGPRLSTDQIVEAIK